jgi:hypothetical protein
MPNPRLNADQSLLADKLLKSIRKKLEHLSAGDKEFLFAMRRKIYIRLMHDERGPSSHRMELKQLKIERQKGLCVICKKKLPEKGAILDRKKAIGGYTEKNTRVIHQKCDLAVQKHRKYRDV